MCMYAGADLTFFWCDRRGHLLSRNLVLGMLSGVFSGRYFPTVFKSRFSIFIESRGGHRTSALLYISLVHASDALLLETMVGY